MLKWQNGNDTVVVDDDDDDGRVDIDGRKKRAATTATMAAENASPPAAITLHLHVGCFLLGISSIPRGLPGDQSPQQGKRRTSTGTFDVVYQTIEPCRCGQFQRYLQVGGLAITFLSGLWLGEDANNVLTQTAVQHAGLHRLPPPGHVQSTLTRALKIKLVREQQTNRHAEF